MSKKYQNECIDSTLAFNDMIRAGLKEVNEFFERNPDMKNPIAGSLELADQGINGVEYHQEQLKASINHEDLKRA